MSMGNSIYVGPYVVGKSPVVHVVERSFTGCLNAGCDSYGMGEGEGARFCPACGGKIGRGALRVDEAIAWYEVSEAIEEALSESSGEGRDDNAHYWRPNVTREGEPERETFDSSSNPCDYLVTPGDVRGETEWLASAFRDEIKTMRQFYESVSVAWGILVWWS